jgi:hypothetical protein
MNDPNDGTNPDTRFTLTPGNLVGGENGWLSAAGWDEYAKLVRLFYTPDVMVSLKTSFSCYESPN